jgi:hypothetical protein
MSLVTGNEARVLFHSTLRDQIKWKESPEFTLDFIQDAFKKLAEAKGEFSIGEKAIRVRDLGTLEVNHLCGLCKKFFKKQENLTVNWELLSNIEKVKQNKHYTKTYGGDFDNIKNLNSVKELIFLNENPEVESGEQKELLDEIKKHAVALKKMRKTARIKRAAFVAVGVAGVVGSVVGAFALLAAGVAGGGFALLVLGMFTSITVSSMGIAWVNRNVERAQKAQDDRIRAINNL